jgi:hypothetical protein
LEGFASLAHVTGDGNCFARALSLAVYGTEAKHATIRAELGDHLEANRDIFSAGSKETLNSKDGFAAFSEHYMRELVGRPGATFEDYVAYVKRPKSYLDTGCLSVFHHRQEQIGGTAYSVHLWEPLVDLAPGADDVFTEREHRERGLYFSK